MLLFIQILFGPVSAEIKPLFFETEFQTANITEKETLDNNMRSEENNPYVQSNRYVEIDSTALRNESTLILNLFDNIKLTAIIERIDERTSNNLTFFGKIENEPISQIIIVLKQDRVTGNIKYQDKVYHIRWMGANVHSVAEVDWKAMPVGGPPVAMAESYAINDNSPEIQAGSVAGASTDDGSTIDVMVAYTQAAASMGDIQSEIQLAIDDINQAMINSSVSLTFRLVHTVMVDYNETGIALTDLNRLGSSGDGFMDGIADLRNTYGADLVALVTETMNKWGGLGQMNSSTPNESRAFHVTIRQALTYGTFAHEVGHNLGMHHEKAQDATGGAYSYSHGYVDLTNRFKTIMSYGTQCGVAGFYCTSINYYSSAPSSGVTYNGHIIGDAVNADNRLTVLNTKLAISRFRQSKSASEIGNIEAVEKGCFITTAAYGSYLDPHVQDFRDFRDQYLEPHAAGRMLMRFYYKNSPPLANVIAKSPGLKSLSRLFLTPLAYMVSNPLKLILLTMAFAFLLMFKRTWRKGGVA